MKIPAYLDERTILPVCGRLEGAWRLTDIMQYSTEYKRWFLPNQELWGPRDYLFEPGFLTIHRPYETKSLEYQWYPAQRKLVFEDEEYFISDLTHNELVLHSDCLRYTFVRINPEQTHRKTEYETINPNELTGLWRIDARYELTDGDWQLLRDFRKEPGLCLWNITGWPRWESYTFGSGPKRHGDYYTSINFKYFVFEQGLKRGDHLFFHPFKDTNGYWAYELGSMTGDYRDSRTKLHLTPIDPSENKFVESLLWAESERHSNTAADKIPLEKLRLWSEAYPDKIESRILDNELIENPVNYGTTEYAGFYVFLHYYVLSVKDYDVSTLANAYRSFHVLISRWLELYDAGKTIKYIYPFHFKKHEEYLTTLWKAAKSSGDTYINFQLVTCEMLRKRIEEIRSNDADHYLYSLMYGLPKEAFYIRIENEISRKIKWEKSNFTLKEFEKAAKKLKPDDPVSLNFFLHRNGPKTIYAINWILYSKSIDRVSEFSTENLKHVFDGFLTAYCEKTLRLNDLFCLSQETIDRFRFTEADTRELTPRLNRFNEEAMTRIREDYAALANLDFIREEIKHQR